MKKKTNLIIAVLVVVIASVAVPNISAQEKEQVTQILFKNVNIFDGKNEKLANGMNLLVEGNKIVKIGKVLKARADATVIDGGGRTLTPGLIDMHQHILLVGGT